jgi:hypothetical protein
MIDNKNNEPTRHRAHGNLNTSAHGQTLWTSQWLLIREMRQVSPFLPLAVRVLGFGRPMWAHAHTHTHMLTCYTSCHRLGANTSLQHPEGKGLMHLSFENLISCNLSKSGCGNRLPSGQ